MKASVAPAARAAGGAGDGPVTRTALAPSVELAATGPRARFRTSASPGLVRDRVKVMACPTLAVAGAASRVAFRPAAPMT